MELTTFPSADLHGVWEGTNPLGTQLGSYVAPTVTVADTAAYTAADSAAANAQTGGLTCPAITASRTLVLIAAVTDETDSTSAPTAPTLPASSASWTLDSTVPSGTITLTYGAQTTSAIAFNASAATIQTELRALSSIGSGNCTVTGSTLDAGTITVTLAGSLANTYASGTITASDPDVVISKTAKGGALKTFTLSQSINRPQASAGSSRPQMHVWSLATAAGDELRPINFEVADHGTLRSWAAVLLTCTGLHATPVPTLAATTGTSATVTIPAITPANAGSMLVAIGAKALAAGFYPDPAPTIATPAGWTAPADDEGVVLGDALTLQVWTGPPVPASVPVAATTAALSGIEAWAGAVIELRAATNPTTGTAVATRLDSTDGSEWVEVAGVAGQLSEVIELDLTGLPAGTVPTVLSLELHHEANVAGSAIRLAPVGISAGGDVAFGRELVAGYPLAAANTAQTSTAGPWRDIDGTPLTDWARLGVAITMPSTVAGLQSHKLWWLRATITYAYLPTVAVTGPASAGDPITWTYTSASGIPQIGYEVALYAGYGADPDTATQAANPLDASAGERIWTTGRQAGSTVRTYALDTRPLGRGHHTAAARVWSVMEGGREIASEWATDDFDAGSAASAPAQTTDPVYDQATTGLVDVTVERPTGATRIWLLRSVDDGATWELTEHGPIEVI